MNKNKSSGELFDGFNAGMLGIIGSFLFFFSANYGQMDSSLKTVELLYVAEMDPYIF